MTKFTFKRKDKRTNLERAIDEVLKVMDHEFVGTEEYGTMLDHFERLYRLKDLDKKDRKSIDPNAIVTALISTFGSIACVLLIASFEQDGIFPTKCFPFIHKGRA